METVKRMFQEGICECFNRKECVKRYFVFNMPTGHYKISFCNTYLRLLLQEKNKYEIDLYSINVESDLKEILIDKASKHIEVYSERTYYREKETGNILDEKVKLYILDRPSISRQMTIREAINLIFKHQEQYNNFINYYYDPDYFYKTSAYVKSKIFDTRPILETKFINEVICTCINYIESIKNKTTKTKYMRLLQLSKKIKEGLNYDDDENKNILEFFTEIFNIQINENKKRN